MTQAQLFLGLSIIFSALVGRVCFLASNRLLHNFHSQSQLSFPRDFFK